MVKRKPSLTLNISKTKSAPPNKSAGKFPDYVELVRRLRNPAEGKKMGRPVGRVPGTSMLNQEPVAPRRKEPETPVQEYTNYFEEDMSGSLRVSTSGTVCDDEDTAKKVQEDTASFETLKPHVYKENTVSLERLKSHVYKKSPKFEESSSGSLSASVSGPVSDDKEMAKEVHENITPFETPNLGVREKLPKSEESSSGSLIAPVSQPMYDDKEMVLENTTSFETLELVVYKRPLMSEESSSGASVSRYVWEDEELTEKIQNNIASFEKLKPRTHKKLKKPLKSDESSSKE